MQYAFDMFTSGHVQVIDLMLQAAFNFVPIYVLVLFRIAGMMIWAPLLGSTQIPKRVKAMIACVLAASIAPIAFRPRSPSPQVPGTLALAIGGEIVFGAAIGLILSLVFVAGQWAGEIIGQQMGLNLGQTLNPQFGGGGSVVGDLYFFLTLLIFLSIGGHMALVKGVFDSFTALPLLSVSRESSPARHDRLGISGRDGAGHAVGRADAGHHARRRYGSRFRRQNSSAIEHHDRRNLRAGAGRNVGSHRRIGFDQLDHPLPALLIAIGMWWQSRMTARLNGRFDHGRIRRR